LTDLYDKSYNAEKAYQGGKSGEKE